jgi:hypothetical protein
MRKMGFESKWIRLIMRNITSDNYFVLINGQPVDKICSSRGIRQNDPLYLLIFSFSTWRLWVVFFTMQKRWGVLVGVLTSKKGPRLSHLFLPMIAHSFASQTLWNGAGWLSCCNAMRRFKRKKKLNKEKISIFFSRNTSQEVRDPILQLSGIPVTQRYDKYLGLSAVVSKSRTREFKSIKNKVWKRLNIWKTKFLFQARNEILLEPVIQAIPTHSMSVFLLPKELCEEINSIMQKFW